MSPFLFSILIGFLIGIVVLCPPVIAGVLFLVVGFVAFLADFLKWSVSKSERRY